MAKYIAQAIIFGSQALGRTFTRTFQEQFAATHSAAHRHQQVCSTKVKRGATIEEDKNIPKVENINDEEDVINYEHCLSINAESKNGSLYLRDKDVHKRFFLFCESYGPTLCQERYFSKLSFNEVFSNSSKQRFMESVQKLKSFPFQQVKYVKEASVLIPLCRVNGEPCVLFTMRSITVSRNKGEVSFPGGMKELSDKNDIEVALRETQEEIGAMSGIEIWTTMPPMPTRKGHIKVMPVVAFIGDVHLKDYSINKEEVEYVFALTLESLCNPKNWYHTQFKDGYRIPVYIIDDYRLWGMTAYFLHQVLTMLLPESYKQELSFESFKLHMPNTKK